MSQLPSPADSRSATSPSGRGESVFLPKIFDATVMHKRMFPRINQFVYRIYYLYFQANKPETLADGWRFGVNRLGVLSFYPRDHINVQKVLSDWNITATDGTIIFVVMPRVLGFGFNPVCFWLCLDEAQKLRAVVAEVHNTFGEQHSYICCHEDQREILQDDILTAQKIFHVSPFMQRSGHYEFRFAYQPETSKLGIWIDYFHEDGRLHLATSLVGKLRDYTRASRRRIFWQIPLISFRVLALIHWQAVKLILKRIRYVPKPKQQTEHVSATLPNGNVAETSVQTTTL